MSQTVSAARTAQHQVRKETAILKQGEKELLTNGGAGPLGSTTVASRSEGIYCTQRRLAVDPPAKLFASYNRDLAATGYALIERHRQCLQGRGKVESAQHLRA